ncbi:MAG: hypothetical protein QM790_13500 [Nibricoccus sp.]
MASFNPIPRAPLLKRLYLCFATGLLALSLVVLAGWTFKLNELVQWGSEWAPIPCAAALGFAFFGISLLAYELGYRRAAFLNVVPAALGLVAVLEAHLPVNLTPDLLNPPAFGGADGSAPVPMTGILALCLFLAGTAATLGGLRKQFRSVTLSLAFSGSLIAAAGCSTLLGYALGLPAIYHWGNVSALAPGAAILLCLLGASHLILAWREHQAGTPGAPAWIPMPIIVASATFSIVLWIGLHAREATYFGTNTQSAINSLASALNSEIEHQNGDA